MRTLNRSRARFYIEVQQDDTPVEGNASAWGEPEDSDYAAEISARLNRGDIWAWALVRVVCTYPGLPFEGEDYLGGCCYRDEADFRQPDGYFDQMCDLAWEDLNRQAEKVRAILCGQDA